MKITRRIFALVALIAFSLPAMAEQKPLLGSDIHDCAEGADEDIKTPVSLPKPTS